MYNVFDDLIRVNRNRITWPNSCFCLLVFRRGLGLPRLVIEYDLQYAAGPGVPKGPPGGFGGATGPRATGSARRAWNVCTNHWHGWAKINCALSQEEATVNKQPISRPHKILVGHVHPHWSSDKMRPNTNSRGRKVSKSLNFSNLCLQFSVALKSPLLTLLFALSTSPWTWKQALP